MSCWIWTSLYVCVGCSARYVLQTMSVGWRGTTCRKMTNHTNDVHSKIWRCYFIWLMYGETYTENWEFFKRMLNMWLSCISIGLEFKEISALQWNRGPVEKIIWSNKIGILCVCVLCMGHNMDYIPYGDKRKPDVSIQIFWCKTLHTSRLKLKI